MIAKDYIDEMLVQITDVYNKENIMPHICNYKGAIEIRTGDHIIKGNEHYVLHTFTQDELQNGFTEKVKDMVEKIILRECQRFGFIRFPMIHYRESHE